MRPPLTSLAAVAAAAIFSIPALAQAQGALLYSTLHHESTSQCMPSPSIWAVNQVTDEEIQYVEPDGSGLVYTSRAFATQNGYCELWGDVDGDLNYWEDPLHATGAPGKIDAVLAPRDVGGIPCPLNTHSTFYSVRQRFSSLAGPADVFRPLPGGVPEFFITDAQIRTALGIPAGVPLNVDAITMQIEPPQPGIFLSFENTVFTFFGPVLDGDVVLIPGNGINWGNSPFDGCAVVNSIQPNTGFVALPEATADAQCAASGISDCYGNPVVTVRDVDGLAYDFTTGSLWFTGEDLVGCGVVTTLGGGAIAVLNGIPLGQPAPIVTQGAGVGLNPTCGTLNGLSLVEGEQCTFVTDTLTPTRVPPGNVWIEAAGLPIGLLGFLVAPANDLPGPLAADLGIPFPNRCFPYAYLTNSIGYTPTWSTGTCAGLSLSGLGPIPNVHLIVQAVGFDAASNVLLSTPTVIDM